MEILDVLNEQGKPTGEVRSRDDCHRLGLRHRIARVWVVTPAGEVLIHRRSPKRRENPNLWVAGSAVGHIAHGQSSLGGAVQETQEELGLTVSPHELDFLHTLQRNREVAINLVTYRYRHVSDSYLLERALTLDEVRPLPEEIAEVRLIPFAELEKIIHSGDPSFAPAPDEYEKIFSRLQARFPNQ